MNNIVLPEQQQIIIDLYNKCNQEIYLCGSAADHYLLNRNYTQIKDLDFITTNNDISKYSNNKMIKLNSKFAKCVFISNWNKHLLEIFLVENINKEDIYFSEKLGISITSRINRLNFINHIIEHNLMEKRLDHFTSLKQRYLA